LRARLAIAVLTAAVPVSLGLAALRSHVEWSTAEESLVDFARDKMFSGGREACENAPEVFPLRPGARGSAFARPPVRLPRDPLAVPERPPRTPLEDLLPAPELRNELWAYGPDFVSRNRDAPPFPAELRATLERGAELASVEWARPGRAGIAVGLRMPWRDGPCAVILVRRASVGPASAVRDLILGAAALSVVVMAAVWLAAGPIVLRVRRLTGQVRDSAASRYATAAALEGSDEVTELAAAFNAAAGEVRANVEAIEARERALRRFVENTTHDVMLPLTVLQGHLTALRRRVESGTVPEREIVVDALEEAHYMASLIQNLSAAARLEGDASAVELGAVDLTALVERAVGRHAPIAKAREIEFAHAVPPSALVVTGDVTLLEQAVSNLIHNAVRYVQPGGHVAVVLDDAGERFSLRVLDDGPGVPPGLEQRVFERAFRAVDARTRQPGGLGLGLSIAKDVCERHGFSLALRRSEGGGAEFEISGPKRAAT
jgi:signal transduction histidine kinase